MSDDSSSDDDYVFGGLLRGPRHEPAEPSLANRILLASQESHFENSTRLFLPEGCLKDLVTQDTVCRETPKLLEASNKSLLEFILNRATKVFAIAVVCRIQNDDLCTVMKKYRKHNFCDASLPLDNEFRKHHPAFHSRFWGPFMLNEFYEKQWMFLSPVFSSKEFVYDLARSSILPFIWNGSMVMEGYSSRRVYEVEIHHSHLEEPHYTVSPSRLDLNRIANK
jgi:hypothetical protein